MANVSTVVSTSSHKIGVVTVTYNGAKVIDDFMRSILAQTHSSFVLYVIDNLSQDDTLQRLAPYADSRIVVIANQSNVGVAAGNNQGICQAVANNCDSVLLINNDTVFDPDLLEKLVSEMAALQCDMLVPKILYFEPSNLIWCAGGYFSWWRAYASLHFGQGEIDHAQFDQPRRINYSPTCCMLIHKAVFDKIGFMDEKYFVYFDDADFCMRANHASLKMMYTPSATLWHKESSATGGAKSAFTLKYSARNKIYFLRKNVKQTWLIWTLFYECYLITRFMIRRDSFQVFTLRQQSLIEGLKLSMG